MVDSLNRKAGEQQQLLDRSAADLAQAHSSIADLRQASSTMEQQLAEQRSITTDSQVNTTASEKRARIAEHSLSEAEHEITTLKTEVKSLRVTVNDLECGLALAEKNAKVAEAAVVSAEESWKVKCATIEAATREEGLVAAERRAQEIVILHTRELEAVDRSNTLAEIRAKETIRSLTHDVSDLKEAAAGSEGRMLDSARLHARRVQELEAAVAESNMKEQRSACNVDSLTRTIVTLESSIAVLEAQKMELAQVHARRLNDVETSLTEERARVRSSTQEAITLANTIAVLEAKLTASQTRESDAICAHSKQVAALEAELAAECVKSRDTARMVASHSLAQELAALEQIRARESTVLVTEQQRSDAARVHAKQVEMLSCELSEVRAQAKRVETLEGELADTCKRMDTLKRELAEERTSGIEKARIAAEQLQVATVTTQTITAELKAAQDSLVKADLEKVQISRETNTTRSDVDMLRMCKL